MARKPKTDASGTPLIDILMGFGKAAFPTSSGSGVPPNGPAKKKPKRRPGALPPRRVGPANRGVTKKQREQILRGRRLQK